MGNYLAKKEEIEAEPATVEVNPKPVEVGNSVSNGDIWNWRIGRQVSGETPNPSMHGGQNFNPRRSVQPGDSTLSRSSSGMWDWSGPPSVAGTPAPSRDSSQHNGVSMWNWGVGRQPSPDVSRENSRHGGMSMWNWGAGRPLDTSVHGSATPSRNNSVHGGVHFSKLAVETGKDRENSVRKGDIWNCECSIRPNPLSLSCVIAHTASDRVVLVISAGAKGRESPTDRPATPDTAPAAAPLKRAPSFGGMWDWGFGRQEPSSPGSSVHNGESAIVDESEVWRKESLERKESIGSSMFNWSLGRTDPISPGASRESSVHNGEGKSMPWAMKLKFGTDSERPV